MPVLVLLRPRLRGLLQSFAFLLLAGVAAVADTSVFDDAWLKVKRNFYDKKLHGVDWDEMRDRYRPEAAAAETRAEEYEVIRRMLAELHASHTALIDGTVYKDHFECEMSGKPSVQAGIEVADIDGEYFVTAVLEGSKADKAGVRKGDHIVRINGDAPEDSDLLADAGGDPGIPGYAHYFLSVPEDHKFTLALQSAEGAKPREISFSASRTNMITASKNSARVIESGTQRLGYIHLWHFLSSDIGRYFDQALAGSLKDCDALILDVRGRGGNMYVAEEVLSHLRKKRTWYYRGKRWTKPVVLLIDENSRSAKEIFAFEFKQEKLGPVVGRKTPGAVLGSYFFELKDGSVLLLPVTDVQSMTGGTRLEGVGVEPTVEVEEPDQYTGGRDLILEEGIHQVKKQIYRRKVI